MKTLKLPNSPKAGSVEAQSAAQKAAILYASQEHGSDPFAYRRAMSHMRNGIATPADYGQASRP